jgi:hypothetical protein
MSKPTSIASPFSTLPLRKLPPRAHGIVFPMVLSLLMSGIVSAIATLRAIGLQSDILLKIVQAWGLSYVIAFPTALAVMPLVRRIVGALVEAPKR